MTTTGTAGFWSYAHDDDAAEAGRILRLADKTRHEYALITGEEIQIFVDRSDIAWGQEWESRISEALQQTTFFIPIVTARYFKRDECRKELLRFSGAARSLGVQDLLLPILYAQVPALDSSQGPTDDEAVELVRGTQWIDWRELRLMDEESSAYRNAINALAKRLVEISDSVAARPIELPPDDEAAEEPGFVDLMAAAEEAMPRWSETIVALGADLEKLGAAAVHATADAEIADREGKGFVGRLMALRGYAVEIDPIADEMLELGNRYAADLVRIDPAMLALIRAAEEEPDVAASDESAEFFGNLRNLCVSASGAIEGNRALLGSIQGAAKLSREVRPPLAKVTRALQAMNDGQVIMEEWVRRLDRL